MDPEIELKLHTPGPVKVHPEVTKAGSRPLFNHRGPKYATLRKNQEDGMRWVLRTRNDIFMYAGSGTLGLQAAISSTVAAGDTVIVDVGGQFGGRHANIARELKANVVQLEHDWGTALEPDALRQALRSNPATQVVVITHNETSTGIVNPVEELAKIVHEESGAILILDTVSGAGAMELDVDGWGIDIAVCASQKAFACPPGMAMLSVSEAAMRLAARSENANLYWDFQKMREANLKETALYTPPITLMMGLERSLEMMQEVGHEFGFEAHRRRADIIRDAGADLGLRLFSEPGSNSNAVVAFWVPEGMNAGSIQRHMEGRYQTTIAVGQADLEDRLIRIGTLGALTEGDCVETMEDLGRIFQLLRN